MNIERTIEEIEIRNAFKHKSRKRNLTKDLNMYTKKKPGEPTRKEIIRATQDFLDSGGSITVIPSFLTKEPYRNF